MEITLSAHILHSANLKEKLATFTLANIYFLEINYNIPFENSAFLNYCLQTFCNQENEFNIFPEGIIGKYRKIWENRNFVWFPFYFTSIWVSRVKLHEDDFLSLQLNVQTWALEKHFGCLCPNLYSHIKLTIFKKLYFCEINHP